MRFGGRYIKDVIYGANDGIITTFAIVAGVAGAGLDVFTIVLLGGASLLADGFSMAASNYLGSKSERDFVRHEYEEQAETLREDPATEKGEMQVLLQEQGYDEHDAYTLVELMFKNKKFFTDLMMHEEYELSSHWQPKLNYGAGLTFLAFITAGFIPILPFIFFAEVSNIFLVSVISTAIVLFIVGALRALVTRRSYIFSGIEMLFVGGVASTIAYSVGSMLSSLLGGI
ncbi:MAG: VIT1/CCC1 transporter family protein [bacterium]|nr:VIT1/CCC1 transporter family protein [bacterium]